MDLPMILLIMLSLILIIIPWISINLSFTSIDTYSSPIGLPFEVSFGNIYKILSYVTRGICYLYSNIYIYLGKYRWECKSMHLADFMKFFIED